MYITNYSGTIFLPQESTGFVYDQNKGVIYGVFQREKYAMAFCSDNDTAKKVIHNVIEEVEKAIRLRNRVYVCFPSSEEINKMVKAADMQKKQQL